MTDKRHRAPRAQAVALTRLTHEYWDRYQELYQEEVAKGEVTRPQSRAKIRLSHDYPERYRELYAQEQARIDEAPEGQRPPAGRPGVWTREKP